MIARSDLAGYILGVVDISIVAPAFNEAAALPFFIRRTTAVLDELEGAGELILVDDGSTDETWQLIVAASLADPRIHGVRLARNFGHQLALTAGLAAADGDAVVTLDADLQHPPEIIHELIATARLGYDVVYAVRSPDDTAGPFKRLSDESRSGHIARLGFSCPRPPGIADGP